MVDAAQVRTGWGALLLAALPAFLAGGCTPDGAGSGGESAGAPAAVADTLLPVNGTRLFVHREGMGAPAIVIHGGPVLDHGYLSPHLEPLARDLELVYYDQRLSGRSDGVVDSASVRLATFVDDIEALRTELGLGQVHLIAHSWGGLLALSYALAHPDEVRSLVLVSPMPPSTALWQDEQEAFGAQLTPEDTAGMGALGATEAFRAREPAAVEAALKHGFRSQFHDPDQAASLSFHIGPDFGERSRQFGFMVSDLTGFDLVEGLRTLEIPTLVVYGADEPGARIGGDVLVEAMPQARRVILDDAGHFAFMEVPAEFTRVVRAFLDEVVRSGG